MAKQTPKNLETMRHSSSHILAAAVLDMFPEAKLAIGPAIENGFYYDFDLPRTLIPEDLPILEEKMRTLIKQRLKFERQDMPIDDALKITKKAKQPYKEELIKDLQKEGKKKVSFYKTGDFIDLCEGPHVTSTKELGAFKLSHISGAYWKGDEKNKMLQRIYGYAFKTQKELDDFLKNLEEAKKRDHRKVGKELELFHFDETVGKGLPLWMPKGATLRQTLERFIVDEETKRGYERTYTPVIGSVGLYKISGHWDHYREEMYPPIKVDKEEYVLRPMTCPHQFMIYKAKKRSYRELPIRYAEMAEMYRKEKSGELSGLFRVMGFTLNDAHIICRPDQLGKEFKNTLDLVQYSLKALGLDKKIWFRASLMDEFDKKYSKNDIDLFKGAEKSLLKYLKDSKIKYGISKGDAAFYGPKLDIQIKNIYGKEETLITIQIDLFSANHFNMSYVDKDGDDMKPVIIHRSAIGCLERTIAFLIEHYGGNFPLWLAPVQVKVIPVSDKFEKFARGIETELKVANLRTELDNSDESVGKKIRNAELQKIPYMLVLGEKEKKAEKVSVRSRKSRDLGQVPLKKLIGQLTKEIDEKK